MAAADALRRTLGGTIREGLRNQGKAYQSYGALLTRFASQQIKAPEFARESLDLYIGAVGDAASTTIHAATEIAAAGARMIGVVATQSAKTVENTGTKVSRAAARVERAEEVAPRRRRGRAKTSTAPSKQA